MSQTYNVAIVGATGAVGETMLSILAERQFPIGRLHLLASARSAGVREVISKEADFDELATLMSKLASSQLDRGG